MDGENPREFMRRFALICGMLLTLSAGVWSSAPAAASSARCRHEMGAPAASDVHDCCRDKSGDSHAGGEHSAAKETSHHAAHEESTTREQAVEAHAGMHRESADASSTCEMHAASLGRRGLSCGAACCAGGSNQIPATAVVSAPEQNKVRRAAASDSDGANDLFAHAPAYAPHLAPARHAPPPHPERRHALIGVFLI